MLLSPCLARNRRSPLPRIAAIMLARLRLPHAAIRDAILRLDDAQLSVDNLKAIKHNAPTSDEVSPSAAADTLHSADCHRAHRSRH